MSIRKVNDGGRITWHVQVIARRPDGTKHRVRKVCARQDEAKKLEAQLRTTVPATKPKEVPTLAAFAEEYMRTEATTNNRARTVREKRGMLRRGLLPRLGALRLDQIDRRTIEAYKAARIADKSRRGSTLGAKTVNEEIGLLARILRIAEDDELIAKMPKVRKLRKSPPKHDHLDSDEQDRLVRAAMVEPDPWGAMLKTALRTGMRMGELRALRWEHVDIVAACIHVRTAADDRGAIGAPKNYKARVIEIPADLVAVLREHRHLRPFVFSNTDGSMLSPRQCEHGIHRACRRAGLRLVGWHALRHSYCSTLRRLGVSDAVALALLGQASRQMLDLYTHMTASDRRAAVALLDRGATAGATGTSNGSGE